MTLELAALRWLLWERRCEIVLCERSPRSLWCGQPDVLGVTQSRYLLEVEVKRSVSDFRADMKKPSRIEANRLAWAPSLPRQFWYLVPPDLAPKVRPLTPAWAGLLSGPHDDPPFIWILLDAPTNRESRRLSVKECCRLVRMVSNHALSVMAASQAQFARWQEGHHPLPAMEYEL